jgi:hypothetical protein
MCKVTYGILVVFKGEKILCKDFAVGSLLFLVTYIKADMIGMGGLECNLVQNNSAVLGSTCARRQIDQQPHLRDTRNQPDRN